MKGFVAALLLVVVGGTLLYSLHPNILVLFQEIPNSSERFFEELGDVLLLGNIWEVETPSPLRSYAEGEHFPLTSEAIVDATNRARARDGLNPLAVNATLEAIAREKLEDMFENQYFEHISPTGEDAGDIAKRTGYAFIVIGENLALGNYRDSAALVDAWLGSPGHRANILGERYTEIGVAVGEGMFEGKHTWLAVQEFGKSLALCPKPDDLLSEMIAGREARLEEFVAELEARDHELSLLSSLRNEDYWKKIEEYNALVKEYNALFESLKEHIASYNAMVRSFNACVSR